MFGVGTILYVPSPGKEGCPTRDYNMTNMNKDWNTVQTLGINGDYTKNIIFLDSQVCQRNRTTTGICCSPVGS